MFLSYFVLSVADCIALLSNIIVGGDSTWALLARKK